VIKIKTFIIFGPTHTGKSTLAGYFMIQNMTERQVIEFENKHKKQVEKEGNEYQNDMRLSYFIDEGPDDHRRYQGQNRNSKGTTKKTHIKTLDNLTYEFPDMKLQILDTPGSDQNYRILNRAISMADIGIYLIDINEIFKFACMLEDNTDLEYVDLYQKIIRPISYWYNLKRDALKTLIIVFSKIDQINYNQIKINAAVRKIRSYSYLTNVPICPISIDIMNLTSYHIFYNSNFMKWYDKEQSLVSLMNRSFYFNIQDLATDQENKREPLFGFVDTKIKPRYKSKEVLRARILCGKLTLKDDIIIGPVVDEMKVPFFLNGKVKTVMPQGKKDENITELDTGSIGSVSFDYLYKNNSSQNVELKYVNPTRLSVFYSTSITNSIEKGNVLIVKIKTPIDKHAVKMNFKLGCNLLLVWFGKFINMTLIGVNSNEESYYLTLFKKQDSYEDVFILPIHELKSKNKYIFYRFALQIENRELLPVNLKKIMTLNNDNKLSMIVSFKNMISDCQTIQDYMSKNSSNYFEYTNMVSSDSQEKELLICKTITSENLKDILRYLRNMIDNLNINSQSININFE